MFTIEDIIKTLNEIEVKGRENMDRLLGAILALEFILKAQQEQAAANVPAPEEVPAEGSEEG